eukprot:gene18302-21335_t
MVLLDQSFFLFEDIHRTVEEVVQSKSITTTTSKKTTVRAEEREVEAEDLNTFKRGQRDAVESGDIEGDVEWTGAKHEVSCKGEGEEEEQVMVVFYTGLVYELCVTPRMSMEGPRLGLLPPFDEAAVSEERLVQWLLQRLVERNEKEEGRYELLMDGMRSEAKKYEKYDVHEEAKKRVSSPITFQESYPTIPTTQPNANPRKTSPLLRERWSPSVTIASANEINDPEATLAPTTAIERHDAVVRLLAHIRKSGMDI